MRIAAVEGLRPTSERIRETLFNWLARDIRGARCLDLFAGTGALGFEALSRGAASVTLVENSRVALEALEESIESLQADAATLVRGDAWQFLGRDTEDRFDIVFLDPPFADQGLDDLCRLLAEKGWLVTGARVYLEQDRAEPRPLLPEGWTVTREGKAGNVRYLLARADGQRGDPR